MVAQVRRSLVPVLMVVTLLVILLYFVLPVSTMLTQRDEAAIARAELSELTARNDALQVRIERLQTREEIERLARRDFNLVYPGEQAYAVLPPPPEAVTVPNTWPFNMVRDNLAN